jgi:DnaK suppressor protein
MKKSKTVKKKKASLARVKQAVLRAKAAKPVKKAVAKPPAKVVEAPPKKLKLSKEVIAKYKGLLLDLRDHLIDGVNFLASDNLKRSHRDASGELSGYSLHMADAGTDNFDREFALSLVSSEQEAIYEIEEALKRLEASTYGLCEMCEKQVRKERLEAVPFARLCIHCQANVEKDRRRPAQAATVFSETAEGEGEAEEESEE